MRRTAALYGFIGLVLIAFGLIDYTIAPEFRFFVWVNLVAGVFALVLWITSSRSALSSIVGRRSAQYGTNAAIYTVAFVGVIVALNYLSALHHRRLDMTSEKVFSLSSQSVKVVKNLKQPLKLIGFFQGGANQQARELYQMYAYASPKVSFEIVDPVKHPELAEKYKISVNNTTHIQYGTGPDASGTNVTQLSEQALTNSIIRVTKSTKKVIDFLDGHGEADIDDTSAGDGMGLLRTALEGEGYQVQKLLLASKPKVPDDVNIVVIAGPVRPLLPHEIDQLNDYLKRGGRVMIMFRPIPPNSNVDESALETFAAQWGVKAGNDVVVDQVVRLFAGPALGTEPLVQNYGDSPITKGFKQRTVFPSVRSLSPMPGLKPGMTVTALAKTSDTSWAETDLVALFEHQTAKLDNKDTRGPITMADSVDADLKTLAMGSGDARLVIFGSTEFAENQFIREFFNRDFLVNSTDWLAGEEAEISIRPRELRASRFRLTVSQFSVVFVLSVLLLPELLLIIGVAVWWERRN
jgi:gliding motility-associatede transport system auxiliary component